ncbi:MAG: DUF6916 family protein [Rudaea sp.]
MSLRLTRRRFLAQGAGVACATLAANAVALSPAPADRLTASLFASQIDRTFTARSVAEDAAPALTVRLRAVEPLRHPALRLSPEARHERSFVLVFDVVGQRAAQDTYRIANAAIGRFDALLVPGHDGSVLTAVFNRLL